MSSIFLSHNHSDKAFVKRIADDLTKLGIRVWVDEAEIQVGDSLIEKIREGIDNVQYVGVVLSMSSIRSEWVKKEVDIAMNQEIEGKRVKVLPLLIDDCDPPGFLKGKLYADFRTAQTYRDELDKLVKRLSAAKTNIFGMWSGRSGLLSLAQHGDDVIGEYQWGSDNWDGDLAGKIIRDRLIFRWNLKNGLEQGVGFFNIEDDELYGAYWHQADAPNYLSLIANPDKISKLLMIHGNEWTFRKIKQQQIQRR